MLQITDQGVISHDPARGAFMPVIAPLSDGSLIASQHVGTSLGSADNHIEVLHSTDNGTTWTNRGSIHGGPPDDGFAYRGPEICEVPDGRLMMTATRFEAHGDQLFDAETEALDRPELLTYWSNDGGHDWGQPETVPVDLPRDRYTANGAGRLLQVRPDRWLYFIETWKPTGWDGPPDQKAALVVSTDQGRTWDEFTVVADDPTGRVLWWDQMGCMLPDGRIYNMFWTHLHGTKQDLPDHWSISDDDGRTWSTPRPTNLPGQVCSPIPLPDGRVAAIYNHRHDPHGIRVAVSEDLEHFDRDNELVVFDAGAEAQLGETDTDQFFEEHMLIGFGKPCGHIDRDGTLLVYFWCTSRGVTHTRWVRISCQ